MEYKKSTISDVARLANTSPATVSRVMNDVDYPVSVDLRDRIRKAAKELNYIPNTAAKNLRRNTSRDIGVVIPNITNLFYPQTVLGIDSAVRDSGYNLLLFNTLRSKQREAECLQMLCERQVKGVIISAIDNTIEDLDVYMHNGMNFVLMDQHLENCKCPSLNFDSRRGARMAVKHFLQKGHTRIAFATTPLTRWTRIETFKGYREVLESSGIGYDEGLVFSNNVEQEGEDADYEVDTGAEIAQRIISSGCDATAILCVNDMVAFGVMRKLAELGKKVPEDISIIGFDDIPFAKVYIPSLTTIRYPAYETGKLAGMLLIENITGAKQISLNMKMDPQFVERKTVRDISR